MTIGLPIFHAESADPGLPSAAKMPEVMKQSNATVAAALAAPIFNNLLRENLFIK